MKNIKRFAVFFTVLCMVLSMTSAFAEDSEIINIRFEGTENYTMAYEVLNLVNTQRAQDGLSPLSMDGELLSVAMQRAAEIAIYCEHTRPDGTSCFTAFPSSDVYVSYGENIAAGQSSAQEVMTGWMNSEGHRENILTAEYKSIGVGCFSQDGMIYWVQAFSSKAAVAPSPVPENRSVTASVNIAPGYCNLGVDIFETDDELQGQVMLYSLNPSFPYEYIFLSNDNVTYASSETSIVTVSSKGVVPSLDKSGFLRLFVYVDDSLIYDNYFVFTDHDFITGDVNGDGDIDNSDLILVARHVVNIPVEIDLLAADTDYDNEITNADIIRIARYIVGLSDVQ